MRILVTGAGGMLGSALVPTLAAAGHDVRPSDIRATNARAWGPTGPDLEALDVRSREDVERAFIRHRPDFVVHLAAETDLEVCEADRDHAFATNSVGTKHVAVSCLRASLPMAYVSTAGVFDGDKGEPYTEFDSPNPINAYGASKLAGERFVEQFVPAHFIVRAGWMVGGGPKDHKFVAKILAQLRAGARTIHAVGDKFGTPTYAPDFASCFVSLIATGSYGLYHMACRGRASRYDVTRRIIEVLGRRDVSVVEVNSDFFRDTYPAPRPKSEMMRNLLLDLQGLNSMRTWEESLEDYLKTSFPEFVTADARA